MFATKGNDRASKYSHAGSTLPTCYLKEAVDGDAITIPHALIVLIPPKGPWARTKINVLLHAPLNKLGWIWFIDLGGNSIADRQTEGQTKCLAHPLV